MYLNASILISSFLLIIKDCERVK